MAQTEHVWFQLDKITANLLKNEILTLSVGS